MARLDSFLELVVQQRASDLHLRSGSVPIVRYCGDLVGLPFRVLSAEETHRLIAEIMTPEHRQAFDKGQEVDFAYALPGQGRFRVHAFQQSRGPGAVIRVIPARIPTVEDLGLPGNLKQLAHLGSGLVLVTGPTGSGKSTTMAALVHEINTTSRRHVITLEDPIEFLHDPDQSLITQRQIGLHTESFAEGLRSALREAPDVIVVGEMRDTETVALALSAAETGALVFGTLHTRTSARAIGRILDMHGDNTADQMRTVLSVVLKGVVAQYLCRHNRGEKLIPAVEVLLQTHAVTHLIRDGKLHQLETYLAGPEMHAHGMQSLDDCVLTFLAKNLITPAEALRAACSADAIRRILAAAPELAEPGALA